MSARAEPQTALAEPRCKQRSAASMLGPPRQRSARGIFLTPAPTRERSLGWYGQLLGIVPHAERRLVQCSVRALGTGQDDIKMQVCPPKTDMFKQLHLLLGTKARGTKCLSPSTLPPAPHPPKQTISQCGPGPQDTALPRVRASLWSKSPSDKHTATQCQGWMGLKEHLVSGD